MDNIKPLLNELFEAKEFSKKPLKDIEKSKIPLKNIVLKTARLARLYIYLFNNRRYIKFISN